MIVETMIFAQLSACVKSILINKIGLFDITKNILIVHQNSKLKLFNALMKNEPIPQYFNKKKIDTYLKSINKNLFFKHYYHRKTKTKIKRRT